MGIKTSLGLDSIVNLSGMDDATAANRIAEVGVQTLLDLTLTLTL